jgi:hypothetical protein
MKKEKEKGITITFVGKQEPNIINNWLDENGNIEIAKQVEKEAKDLCEQETLEEAAERILFENTKNLEIRYRGGRYSVIKSMLDIAKWQQEQDKKMYSKEEVIKFGQWLTLFDNLRNENKYVIKQLLKQFKNK